MGQYSICVAVVVWLRFLLATLTLLLRTNLQNNRYYNILYIWTIQDKVI